MKKVLITGSTGFIGRHIKQLLTDQGIEVVEFCRKNNQDVARKEDFLALTGVDTVFHLAAVSGYQNSKESVSLAYKVNVLGTVNVLEYCRRVKAKCIFASTYVYAKPYQAYKQESDPADPTTHYAFTKYLGEELCRFYSRIFKVDALILRTSNVYGPGQEAMYIVPVIANHILANDRLILTRPEIERSFIYIDDLTDAYVKLAKIKTLPGEIFNVGPKKPTKLRELVALMVALTGKHPQVSYSGQGRSGEADYNRVRTTKLQKTINWKPRIDLKTGLNRYLKQLIGELKSSHHLE